MVVLRSSRLVRIVENQIWSKWMSAFSFDDRQLLLPAGSVLEIQYSRICHGPFHHHHHHHHNDNNNNNNNDNYYYYYYYNDDDDDDDNNNNNNNNGGGRG